MAARVLICYDDDASIKQFQASWTTLALSASPLVVWTLEHGEPHAAYVPFNQFDREQEHEDTAFAGAIRAVLAKAG